jgi:release factor glutamine methyltransferase
VTATAAALLRSAAARLAEAGVEDAPREARLLLAHVLGVEAGLLAVDGGRAVDADAALAYDTVVARRAAREPFSQIVGRRGFWRHDFAVTADVLTPRPDSETLVEAALARFPDRAAPLRVLDLGTGTGCLLLSVLGEYPNATGLGIDRSAAALAVAAGNARHLGLAHRAGFAQSDWDGALGAGFDIVLCNPPYIPSAEIGSLAPEVARFEPRLALDGGADGLDAYRALAPALARLIAPGGAAFVEVGAGQGIDVKAIFESAGLSVAAIAQDLAGIGRCVIAMRPTAANGG